MSLSGLVRAKRFIFLGLILTWAPSASAQSTGSLLYSNEIDGALIGEATALLAEDGDRLEPAQVIERWEAFTPNPTPVVRLTRPDSGHWVRWTMSSKDGAESPIIEVATSGFKRLDFYRLDGQSLVHLGRSGRRVAFEERIVPDTHHAFPVQLTSVPTTYLLRIETSQKKLLHLFK